MFFSFIGRYDKFISLFEIYEYIIPGIFNSINFFNLLLIFEIIFFVFIFSSKFFVVSKQLDYLYLIWQFYYTFLQLHINNE